MQQLHFHCARLACLTNQIQLSMPVRPVVPVLGAASSSWSPSNCHGPYISMFCFIQSQRLSRLPPLDQPAQAAKDKKHTKRSPTCLSSQHNNFLSDQSEKNSRIRVEIYVTFEFSRRFRKKKNQTSFCSLHRSNLCLPK